MISIQWSKKYTTKFSNVLLFRLNIYVLFPRGSASTRKDFGPFFQNEVVKIAIQVIHRSKLFKTDEEKKKKCMRSPKT